MENSLEEAVKKLILWETVATEKIDGVWMHRSYKDLGKDIIDNFEVYDDDVWICTFPKAGTTWTQEMTWLLANNLNYEGALEDLDGRVPFLELSAFVDANTYDLGMELPPFVKNSMNYIRDMKRPRIIKTHLPWKLLPKQIQTGQRNPKIIHVSRNPKDSCISFYHHLKLIPTFIGTFNEFALIYYNDRLQYMPYWEHLFTYWNNKQSNIIHIKYEDMKNDLESVIQKIATFLNTQLNNEELKKLVHHLSFDQMKNNKAVNKDMFHKALNPDMKGSFIRSGKVGSYKEEMSLEENEAFDKWIYKNIKNTDYKV